MLDTSTERQPDGNQAPRDPDPGCEPPSHLLPLLAGEVRALALARNRRAIDLSSNDSLDDDPARASAWDESRRMRGRFLEWLITESSLCSDLPANRLGVFGASIVGPLDLSFRKVPVYLLFRQCSLAGGARLQFSRFSGVEFVHVVLGVINAWAAQVEGLLRFERVQLSGMLQLANAKILGDLIFDQSTIDAIGGLAINAPNLGVGNFMIENTRVRGRLNLTNAVVSGECLFGGGKIDPDMGLAVGADNISISGRLLFVNGIDIKGTVRLNGARIGGEFNLYSAKLTGTAESALEARWVKIGGSVLFTNGFYSSGRITLSGAEIGGELNFTGAELHRPWDLVLDLRVVTVKGAVNLSNGFSSSGSISLYGADIRGDLTFVGASLTGAKGMLLDGRRLKSGGSAFFNDGFSSDGPISLFGASIAGDLNFIRSNLKSGKDSLDLAAIRATSLRVIESTIEGGVQLIGAEVVADFLIRNSSLSATALSRAINADNLRVRTVRIDDRTTIEGAITFVGARVSGDMIVDASFVAGQDDQGHDDRLLFSAASMRCDGVLYWRGPEKPPAGTVNLEHAHVGGLHDDADSWPTRLRLDGFTYDRLIGESQKSVDLRLSWLKKQRKYNSQPFEQLIGLYRKLGDSNSAAEVAISKWRLRRSEMPKWSFRKFWDLGRLWDALLDLSSGYGYRPWRPLLGLVSVLLIGAAVYHWGKRHDAFCLIETLKSQPPCVDIAQAPRFNAFAYSVETLLPIGELGQRRFYTLRGDSEAAKVVGWYTLVHRLFGSVFSLLLALAPTNILRRE
jgi:hypothetical protein